MPQPACSTMKVSSAFRSASHDLMLFVMAMSKRMTRGDSVFVVAVRRDLIVLASNSSVPDSACARRSREWRSSVWLRTASA